MKLHLNVFGDEACSILRDALCESSIKYDFIKTATDNEVIVDYISDNRISTPILSRIIRRLKWYAKSLDNQNYTSSPTLYLDAKRTRCLADLLSGMTLEEVKKKYNNDEVTKIFDVQRLDPFVSEAIAILEEKKRKIHRESTGKIDLYRRQIYEEEMKKYKEIDEEIAKLKAPK